MLTAHEPEDRPLVEGGDDGEHLVPLDEERGLVAVHDQADRGLADVRAADAEEHVVERGRIVRVAPPRVVLAELAGSDPENDPIALTATLSNGNPVSSIGASFCIASSAS